MSPFVSKVSVEIHTRTETKSHRVGVPVLPPESVHRVRVLVPAVVNRIKGGLMKIRHSKRQEMPRHFVQKPLGGFGCLELCLYGIKAS